MAIFCKPISSKKRFIPYRKLFESYSFTLYEKAALIPENDLLKICTGDVFFNKNFLNLIEKCKNIKVQMRYCVIYENKLPIGFLYCQITDFNAGVFGELVKNENSDRSSKTLKLFEKYLIKNRHENLLRLFTCGNNLVSGEHGFCFINSVPEKIKHQLVLHTIDLISKEETKTGTISAVLIKDFEEHLKPKQLFKTFKYEVFTVEPNLILEFPKKVDSLDEYIQLFSKKYRNRAKNIQKKFLDIDIKELNITEIKTYETEIYSLYIQVFKRAKFKLLQLPNNYFSECKLIFKEQFKVYGFFKNNQLIAFNSSFLLKDNVLEAHYIGINYELNKEYELYQNTLCNIVTLAINQNKKIINFGRTAAEIKTTIGAKPKELYCYIKAQNTISKLVQKSLIKFLKPDEWIPRNPFKEE
ncbi:MAG: hypothetical protein LCH32_12775 [Bacteroidetes bacterium]|nr:hypothetical protein [Bacteroidota bacterium]